MTSAELSFVATVAAAVSALVGPIAAVSITLWWEGVRRRREAKQTLLRTILTTRGSYADPGYNWAIRSVPLEFAGHRKVMVAYEAYRNSIRTPPPEITELHRNEATRRENILISEMLKALGYHGLTADQIEVYTSRGFALREQLLEGALDSIIRMSSFAERSARASEIIVERLPKEPDE